MVVTTQYGFDVLPGGSGLYELTNLNGEQQQIMLDAMREAAKDYNLVLIDNAAGIGDNISIPTKSAQLLLVDSEGWNVRRAGGIRKQRMLWDEIPSAHRVLVMPANMDEMDGMEMLSKAGALDVNQLAFSKLDETSRPGKIVNWAAASGMNLSYCGFGPEVPEQMGWLTPHALTALLSSQEIRYAKETA